MQLVQVKHAHRDLEIRKTSVFQTCQQEPASCTLLQPKESLDDWRDSMIITADKALNFLSVNNIVSLLALHTMLVLKS